MSIPGSVTPLFNSGAAAAASGYQIARSLRFNSSDSGFCSRTFTTPTGNTQWTWAGWVKRNKTAAVSDVLFSANTSAGTDARVSFFLDDTFLYYDAAGGELKTAAVYRDFSAWMHVCFVYDSPNATSTDRLRLYINGVRVTAFGTASYPSQNAASIMNAAKLHKIGEFATVAGYYANMYLADIHFIDGQALDATAFTEVSATTGQLIPKAYTGSFGTNGFWLKFSDNSAATATTLGKDYSGNNNNWTPNNLSVTAGAGNDSLVDTPTSYGTSTGIGGEQRGNYAVLNPLDKNPDAALANGNLDYTPGGSVWRPVRATIGVTSGKWYWEVFISNIGILGIATQSTPLGNDYYPGIDATSYGYTYVGTKYNNGSSTSYGSSYTTGDLIGVAYDADNGKVWFSKNGTWQASGDPAAGTNAAYTGINTALTYFPMIAFSGTGTSVFNAGQRAFAYTAPSGFKALCDTNLPAPVVAKPNTVFDVKLYDGNGSTQTISGLGFSPDWVWLKKRSGIADHYLYDTIRGATYRLYSNTTDAESTSSTGLTAFTSTGFDLGSANDVNQSSNTYVAWCWDAGSDLNPTTINANAYSAGVPSITSSCRTNQSSGFSIVSYTAAYTGSARTVGHGLGVKPSLIILKNRSDGSANWRIYHSASGASLPLILNSTAAAASNFGIWNDTEPTSSVFTVGINTDVGGNIGSGDNLIAYCFSPVAGYSSFGSFVTNGADDNVFVYTGFRPRWIMWKRTDAANSWGMVDTARNTYNVVGNYLLANASDAEANTTLCDILSNGFKMRTSGFGNGQNYIYAAFAESPFQYARAR